MDCEKKVFINILKFILYENFQIYNYYFLLNVILKMNILSIFIYVYYINILFIYMITTIKHTVHSTTKISLTGLIRFPLCYFCGNCNNSFVLLSIIHTLITHTLIQNNFRHYYTFNNNV